MGTKKFTRNLKIFSIVFWRAVLFCCFSFTINTHAKAEHLPSESRVATVINEGEILALSDEIKHLVDIYVKPARSRKTRAIALLDLMFSADKMHLRHESKSTKTAMKTLNTGSGNRLLLANTYIAMARYAGLRSHFLSVRIPRHWLEKDGTYYLSKHTTAAVKLRHRKRLNMEFAWTSRLKPRKTRAISDKRAYAEYYSNIGAGYLEQSNLIAAEANLEYAIKMDDSYSHAWSNVGVVYRRLNKFTKAEKA